MKTGNVHILSIGSTHYGFESAEKASKAFTLLSEAMRLREDYKSNQYVYHEDPPDGWKTLQLNQKPAKVIVPAKKASSVNP